MRYIRVMDEFFFTFIYLNDNQIIINSGRVRRISVFEYFEFVDTIVV